MHNFAEKPAENQDSAEPVILAYPHLIPGIPPATYNHEHLTLGQRHALAALAALADREGIVAASQRKIASRAGICDRSLRRHIPQLVAMRLLEVLPRNRDGLGRYRVAWTQDGGKDRANRETSESGQAKKKRAINGAQRLFNAIKNPLNNSAGAQVTTVRGLDILSGGSGQTVQAPDTSQTETPQSPGKISVDDFTKLLQLIADRAVKYPDRTTAVWEAATMLATLFRSERWRHKYAQLLWGIYKRQYPIDPFVARVREAQEHIKRRDLANPGGRFTSGLQDDLCRLGLMGRPGEEK